MSAKWQKPCSHAVRRPGLTLACSWRGLALAAVVALAFLLTAAAPPAEPALEALLYLPVIQRQLPPPWCGPPEIFPDDLAKEQETLDGLNAERAAAGLPPLTSASELTQAARRHSNDMADNNFTSHTGSDGSSGGQRMSEACYEWSNWAEIIGWGFAGDTTAMIDWWMNSPTHHDIILSAKYADFGAGYAINAGSDYQHYWTVNFGARRAPDAPRQPVYTCVYLSPGLLGGSMLIVSGAEPCQ